MATWGWSWRITDKGMPAALLMANARSVLRGVAASAGRSGWDSPARLLAQVNDVLSEETPMDMFVTCLLALLDPVTGHVRYANAGHNPPYLCNAQGAVELRATGIPLGLFPDLEYEEKEMRRARTTCDVQRRPVEAHSLTGLCSVFPSCTSCFLLCRKDPVRMVMS
jgi:hypothetical protein